MIIDTHTHIGWYPDHISKTFAEEGLASKLVKARMSGGQIHGANLDLHSYDSTPESHWKATRTADKTIVFGLQARAAGYWVPNDLVAEYVAEHPDDLVGWASVDPNDPSCVEELERCYHDLKLRGLKLGPAYQHFDPAARTHWPLFEKVKELGIPIVWHQGTTFPSAARLSWANPLQLEDVVMDFPDIKMIVAHLGHPWEEDLIALMRKAPNVYADISAVHYRPWRYWQAMATAMEYGVTHKLLLASDFPSATVDNVILGLRAVNDPVAGSSLPKIPVEIQESIIHENWKSLFPEWASLS